MAIAKKAVEEVPKVKLILQFGPAEQKRTKSLGIIISPTFVLEGEICIIGEPRLEHLISELKLGIRGINMKRGCRPRRLEE